MTLNLYRILDLTASKGKRAKFNRVILFLYEKGVVEGNFFCPP